MNPIGQMENLEAKSPVAEAAKSEPLYAAFVNIRNVELAAYWTRYNIQSAINFGLLAAVLTSNPRSLLGDHLSSVAATGVLLSGVWLLLTIKGKQILNDRWEKHLRLYEKSFQLNYRLFTEVEIEEDSNWFRHWDNLNILTRAMPIICIAAWYFLSLA